MFVGLLKCLDLLLGCSSSNNCALYFVLFSSITFHPERGLVCGGGEGVSVARPPLCVSLISHRKAPPSLLIPVEEEEVVVVAVSSVLSSVLTGRWHDDRATSSSSSSGGVGPLSV